MEDNQLKLSSLEEIANWQLDADNSDVGLPAMQRGFVWKPKQIETLWDSLLRGFPIGSFLVSKNGEKQKKDLLDGQQRATAIALGFYNPWEESQNVHFFSKKFNGQEKGTLDKTAPLLWLDIGIKEGDTFGEKGDCLFLPRLVTQSHPWGYKTNGTPVEISTKRNAMIRFDKTGNRYPEYILKDVFPVKAELPVPICFLISSIRDSPDDWTSKLIEKCKNHLFSKGVKDNTEIDEYYSKLQSKLNEINITKKIKNAVTNLILTEIPIINLQKEQIQETTSDEGKEASTLFVRINTAGTVLSGEELIYSMCKSVFPESKEIVENAGVGFISPSRIITLISRIVLTDMTRNENQEFSFSNQINPKQFRGHISNDAFLEAIRHLLYSDNSYIENLFSNARILLSGSKDNVKEFQLPFPLAAEIARNSNVFFILLYWLHKSKGDILNEVLNNEILHKKILASVTTLCWFTKEPKDFNKFLMRLTKEVQATGSYEFWDSKLFSEDSSTWPEYIPNPCIVRNTLEKKINKKWEEIYPEDEISMNMFKAFFNKINFQRQLLIYAQRNYINSRFKELLWDTLLEDTNRPYDWDHIYMDSWWTYSTVNQSTIMDGLRWSNGNFRALALEDNRSEGNRCSPKDRLEENKEISFITENNWSDWKQIDKRINGNEPVEILAKAILHRLADIYEEWYVNLGVGELFNNKVVNQDNL